MTDELNAVPASSTRPTVNVPPPVAELLELPYGATADVAQPRLLAASYEEDPDVRAAALLGFATLARLGKYNEDREVWRRLIEVSDSDPSSFLRGRANDVMDDLEIFGSLGSAGT